MQQLYSIILWRYTEKTSENNTAKEAKLVFDILTELNAYGNELSPFYTTAYSKESAERFILNYDNVYTLLKKKDLPNLYVDKSFSFFSDKEDENCSKISFGIGNTGKRCPNTLIIQLPTNIIWYNSDFENLFLCLVSKFNPYFACVMNNFHKKELWDKITNLPTNIHWMNFFDKEVIKNFNISKENIEELFEKKYNGYFLKISSEIFDCNNKKHIEKQKYLCELLAISNI